MTEDKQEDISNGTDRAKSVHINLAIIWQKVEQKLKYSEWYQFPYKPEKMHIEVARMGGTKRNPSS
jgi:hypothetical protein